MSVTADELRADLEKYLKLAENEDVEITNEGKVVACLISPYKDRLAMAESLFGVIPPDASLEEAREERMRRI